LSRKASIFLRFYCEIMSATQYLRPFAIFESNQHSAAN
jgi:hypothetical protein